MTDKKILYVEDDLSLIEGLKFTLEKNGFTVDNARTVKEAYRYFPADRYGLLLLDVTLPDGTGFDICREARKDSSVPIIFLTASDEEISIVKGLDMGGDDYITKPFRLGEVLSRINALLRRSGQFQKRDAILESNGIRIDPSRRLVWKGETELALTLVEYKLLCLFLENPDRVLFPGADFRPPLGRKRQLCGRQYPFCVHPQAAEENRRRSRLSYDAADGDWGRLSMEACK